MDDSDRRAAAIINATAPRRARQQRRKLFDGKTTAEEVHRKHVFGKGAKCAGCGGVPSIMLRVFYPLDEVVKRDGMEFGRALLADADRLRSLLTEFLETDGVTRRPYVRVSTSFSCKRCQPVAEKAAARLPSWTVVQIDRGPGADKLVFGWDGDEYRPPVEGL